MEQKLDVVKVWQDLHKTPELGFEEVKTSAYLAEALEKIGYEVHRGIAKTGVVGYKRTNVPRHKVLTSSDSLHTKPGSTRTGPPSAPSPSRTSRWMSR